MFPRMFQFNVFKILLFKHMTTADVTLIFLLSSPAQKRLFTLGSSKLKAHMQHMLQGWQTLITKHIASTHQSIMANVSLHSDSPEIV